MRKIFVFTALLLCTLVSFSQKTIAIKCGKLLDTRSGQVLTFVPVAQFALDVQKAGGWLEYMRDHSQAELEAESLESATPQGTSTQGGHHA